MILWSPTTWGPRHVDDHLIQPNHFCETFRGAPRLTNNNDFKFYDVESIFNSNGALFSSLFSHSPSTIFLFLTLSNNILSTEFGGGGGPGAPVGPPGH